MPRKRQAETKAAVDATQPTAGAEAEPAIAAAAENPAASPAPAAEALGIVEQPAAAVAYREIPLDQVFPSPLNPRKRRSDAGIDALALSIAQKGLLQPILVRPSPQLDIKGERFEIILGARRHAAALRARQGIADENGTPWQLPADWALPCRVRVCDDDELVILAGVENFDREDMDPLDEAELFAAVRPRVKPATKSDGTAETREAAIARLFHIGESTVFRRLALTRLAPELTQALRDREITLGQAQAFALGSHNDQRRVWKESGRDKSKWQLEPARLRSQMVAEKIPVAAALFDPALYAGERIVDGETGEAWFADAGEFARLQDQAAQEKADELKPQWPWVEIHRGSDLYSNYVIDGVKKTDKSAGAVIHLDTRFHRSAIHAPALRRKDYDARERARTASKSRSGGATEPTQRPPLTEAQVRAVHATKTRALRRALIADPKAALAQAVLGLLGETQIRGLQPSNDWQTRGAHAIGNDEQEDREILRLLATAALPLPPDQRPPAGKRPRFGSGWDTDDPGGERHPADPATWFRALYELGDDDLAELHRRLVAERCGSWAGFAAHNPPWLGDSKLAIAVAETVGAAVELPALWRPDAEFFKGYSRDRLFAIVHGQLHITGANRMKKGELVDACLAAPAGFWRPELFPELRFQPEEAAQQALDLTKSALPSPAPRDDVPFSAHDRGGENEHRSAAAPAQPRRSDEDCIAEARELLHRFDGAVLAGREGEIGTIAERIEELAGELGGDALAAALRARPGTTPLWGRPGDVTIDWPVDERTIPVRLVTEGLLGDGDWCAFTAYAVDPELPFLEASGVAVVDFFDQPPVAIDFARWALAELDAARLTGPGGESLSRPRPLVPIDDAARAKLLEAGPDAVPAEAAE